MHAPVEQSHGAGAASSRHSFEITPFRPKSVASRSAAGLRLMPECVPLSVAGGTFVSAAAASGDRRTR